VDKCWMHGRAWQLCSKNGLDTCDFDYVTRFELFLAAIDHDIVHFDCYLIFRSSDEVAILTSVNHGCDAGSEPPRQPNAGHPRSSDQGQFAGQNVALLVSSAFDNCQRANGLMYRGRGIDGRLALSDADSLDHNRSGKRSCCGCVSEHFLCFCRVQDHGAIELWRGLQDLPGDVESSIRRGDRTDLVTKFDRVLADGNVVSVLQYRMADALTIHVGAIKALNVFDHIVVALRVDPGVMSGDGRIVDAKDVVGLTTNGDCATRKQELL